jgi:hypothetical protein
MSRICTTASPLGCYWVVQGSEARLGDYAYAVCRRMRGRDRIVNEADCARCPLWRTREDDAESTAEFPSHPLVSAWPRC